MKNLKKFIKYGNEQLLTQIPEWQDNEIAVKEKNAIRDYGMNVLGYSSQEMDSVYDYRVLLGLRNAWLQHKTVQATKVKPTEKKAVSSNRPTWHFKRTKNKNSCEKSASKIS